MGTRAIDIKTRRKMAAILRVLHNAGKPLGSQRIGESLRTGGIDLGERTVRNYLLHADELGWTENLGRRGRRLTRLGIQELEGELVVDKVGFVAAKVDTLAYQMDFDAEQRRGTVILNISTISMRDARPAIARLMEAFDAGLGMGRLLALGAPGDQLGGMRVPKGSFAIGTVCSVTINGIFLQGKIAATSRFGGLVEVEQGRPLRFTQIITYDGSSLDPLEIFIRGHMTSVTQAVKTGNGVLGASFREAPAVAMPEIRRRIALSERAGLGGVLALGNPGQPLLDIPVPQGRVGLVVCGGLNPIAGIVEAGIAVTSTAMSTLCDYETLIEYGALRRTAAQKGLL